jgi:dTDP-L-rhamnose 4-epimerase
VTRNVLITGGAGFIGSHLADRLLALGHRVRVLDALDEQVHPHRERPPYLSAECELMAGDVRDPERVAEALRGMDTVVHLAAAVGVGQSMYEIARYVDTNVQGTAVLLQELLKVRDSVSKLLVASSMSVYGEGAWRCTSCGNQPLRIRRERDDLLAGRWDPVCSVCSHPLSPAPTSEAAVSDPTSIYAISKQAQEELVLTFGHSFEIPSIALRFFNVYGPRQALSNPYTGVVAIFAARLLNDQPPLVFEDGHQTRDLVHVSDLVEAHVLALESDRVGAQLFNVGTGQPASIADLAIELAAVLKKEIPPLITNRYRDGDIRHCFADVSLIRDRLGFRPRVLLSDGLVGLLDWLSGQKPDDLVELATRALQRFGLVTGEQPVH